MRHKHLRSLPSDQAKTYNSRVNFGLGCYAAVHLPAHKRGGSAGQCSSRH